MAVEGRSIFNTTLWTGLFIVAAGVVLLLDRAGLVHAGHIFRFWPVFLIVLGLSMALGQKGDKCCQGSAIGGGIMALWGALLLAQNFGYLAWGQIWPIVLIVIGVLMIWQSFRLKGLNLHLGGKMHPTSVFASVERTITDQNFQQGKAETVFGSIQLDFLSADITNNATLEIAAVFGSVEIRVPSSWNVAVEATTVFGSAENKTRPPLATATPKTLTIRGEVVFGSLEIKN